MGATASAVRRPSKGDFSLPNSIAENQAALSNAELRLALVICRTGGVDTWQKTGAPTGISENKWSQWTGLTPRMLEYAAAGLKAKGLQVEGRGEKARYYFQRQTWETFLRERPAEKPRTEGRRAVDPKPGAKVHPECRERGCAMLDASGQAAASGLSLCVPPNIAQPVSQTEPENQVSGNPAQSTAPAASKPLSLIPLTKLTKPVAQIGDAAEQIFAKTLEALRGFFPLVGLAFLLRLLSTVKVLFADVTDDELSSAVLVAGNLKKGYQKSEGLFLLSVPAALSELRRRPKPPDIARSFTDGVAGLLRATGEALRARGGPFVGFASRCDQLASTVIAGADLETVEAAMLSLETEIVRAGVELLDQGERLSIAAAVESELGKYKGRCHAVMLQQLQTQIFERQILATLGVPRLSTFSV